MAVTQALCNSFKIELLNGGHNLTQNILKVALYDSNVASLDKTTTVYTTEGEVSGQGYQAGGIVVTNVAVSLDGDVAIVTFDPPSWPSSTITADSMLLYNTSNGNKAIAVFLFGVASSVNGAWTAYLPDATATTALIRIN